jgi:Fe2+ or Zn2+ uptake regulation protein
MKPTAQNRRLLLQDLRGNRIAAQRRTLVENLQTEEGHLATAALLELARKHGPDIDRATVCRTIERTNRLRLMDELDLMHLNSGGHLYEAKPDIDRSHLAHFDFGAIEERTSPLFEQLKAELSRQEGFHIRFTRLEAGSQCWHAYRPAAVAERSPHARVTT